MKPVTALAVIVVVFLVILGIVFWQLGLFNGKPPETTVLIEPITPTDLAGITPTGLAGVPTYYDSISSTGGLDQFYNPLTPVQPTSTSYTVKPGDTLWIIAQHFYNGDGTKWKMIQDANKITNPSKLKAGMVLTIPDASDTTYRTTAPAATDTTTGTYTPSTTGGATAESRPNRGGKYHKVVKGDTLWKLARKYYNDSTKTTVIFDANRDKMATPETTLQPGWKLLIPEVSKKESKPKTSSKKTTPKTTAKTPGNTVTPPPVAPSTPPPANPTTGGDNTPTGSGD